MKSTLQLKTIILGAVSSVAAFTLTIAAGKMFQPAPVTLRAARGSRVIPPAGTLAHRGYELFLINCAHCHGIDARGEEGPDLHGVTKSDARIASLIQNGIKGEMPRFGAKLSDAEIHALIAFVRSLKDE